MHKHGREESYVYVVVRTYDGQGASKLAEALTEHEAEVRDLLSSVPGFRSYAAFRTDSGVQTVTVCDDQEGTEESSQRAAGWVKETLQTSIDAPTVTAGNAFLSF